jgi:hypothetical protein
MSIQIFYDNVEITTSVLYASASFESQLGAQPGAFEFIVKDPDQVLSFTVGKRVRLVIDGTKMYGGFVMQVGKRFAFPVVDTVTNGPEEVTGREWIVRGVDYNILFDKRFLFNLANPRLAIPASTLTTDTGILALITGSYLDLSSDDIDVTTHVVGVGDPAPDGKYGFKGVGQPWRDEMVALTAKTGAIWYLAPGTGSAEIDLYLRGREVFDPGWGFSDTPNNVTTFGFRELDSVEDASNLVNDGLVWGGNQYGVSGTTGQLVFGRSIDQDSIDDLFRSQRAEPQFGDEAYLTDAHCEIRAKVIVWGNAEGTNNPGGAGEGQTDPARGLRNPQRYLRLSWFGDTVPTVLTPGSVVSVYLSTFDETLTLPVRNIRIRFESPEIIRYEGYLGVQTDDPFTLWQHMAAVQSAGGTAGSFLDPVSDGSSTALVGGTQVCMATIQSANGTRTKFTITDPYQTGTTRVWVNGLRWRPGIEYVESIPEFAEIEFIDAPLAGDNIWVCYTSSGLTV